MSNTSIRLGSVQPIVDKALKEGIFDNVSEMVRQSILVWEKARIKESRENNYLISLANDSKKRGGYTSMDRAQFMEFMQGDS